MYHLPSRKSASADEMKVKLGETASFTRNLKNINALRKVKLVKLKTAYIKNRNYYNYYNYPTANMLMRR